MLLASTKASFKSDFGQSFIQHEFQITSAHELKFDIFERRLNKHGRDDDTTPMTTIEKELNSASKDRIALPFAMQATQTLRGVQFPVDQDALKAIKRFGDGELDFVQLSVDTLNEAIKLEGQEERLKASDLNSKIPKAKPRYSLFRVRDVDEKPVCKLLTSWIDVNKHTCSLHLLHPAFCWMYNQGVDVVLELQSTVPNRG